MYDKDLINLTSYIKHKFIKEEFSESCEFINSEEDINPVVQNIISHKTKNVIIKTSILKEQFFETINMYKPDSCIVNCNSNYNRFKDTCNESNGLIIYNNVNNCFDSNILNYIKENKGIMIC